MEDDTSVSKEIFEARDRYRTALVKLGKQVSGQRDGTGPDLSNVPPHLMNKQ